MLPLVSIYPPEITLEKSRDHWYVFSLFPLDFFHLWPQIWAHMGPYGPVWTRISFDVAFIWIICGFYIVFIWFSMALFMIFEIVDIFWKLSLHIFWSQSYNLSRIIFLVLRPRSSPYNAKIIFQYVLKIWWKILFLIS